MLRRFALSLCLLGLHAFCADEAKAVEEAERGWATGVAKNDFALLEKVLADDLTYTHSTGAVDTKATYIGNLKSGKSRYLSVEYEQLKVQVLSKDAAIAICRAMVTTVQEGKPSPAHL